MLSGSVREDFQVKGSNTASHIANDLNMVAAGERQTNLTVKADGVVLRPNATLPKDTEVVEVVDITDYEWPSQD